MLNTLKRYWPLWLAVALLLIVAYLPARLLQFGLPPTVQLDGVTGTVWHGRAARASINNRGQVFMLGGLDWQLRPWSLLVAQPTAEVRSRWGAQQIDTLVATNWRGDLLLSDLSAAVGIDWTRQMLPLYVEGLVRGTFARLEVRGGKLWVADGQLVWERAAWAARAGSLPLGAYAIELSGDNGNIRGEVVTISGGLQASGQVSLNASNYMVNLRLSGPAMQNDGLRQSMALFAVPEDDGYVVDLSGSL